MSSRAATPSTILTASACRSMTRRCATRRKSVPLVVFAGKEYGTGSSRDWAAKGTKLLGVRAVIAQSFERIHRSNLVGMGVLPLVFEDGTSWQSLGLKGDEMVAIEGLARRAEAAPEAERRDHRRRRQDHEGAAHLPHRYARRARILQATAASCTMCCGSSRPEIDAAVAIAQHAVIKRLNCESASRLTSVLTYHKDRLDGWGSC